MLPCAGSHNYMSVHLEQICRFTLAYIYQFIHMSILSSHLSHMSVLIMSHIDINDNIQYHYVLIPIHIMPTSGWRKVNFNGASKGNLGLSGYGTIVRDEKGRLVRAICGQVGIPTNNIAEITALGEGLKWATSNGATKVVIEGDSKVILSGIIKRGFMNWWLNAWIPRIYCLLQNLMDYHLQHTFRKGNQVADFLANQGITKTLLAVLSLANAGNRDLQKILYSFLKDGDMVKIIINFVFRIREYALISFIHAGVVVAFTVFLNWF
ncbi:hypothetical protein SUGI_0118780 [Cryptomeria japonica]|nr:hypothetical protein SUGI_0118780 [Cryptomeria japonica]